MFGSCLFFIGPEPCKTSEDLAVPPTNNFEEGDAVVLKSEGLSFYGTIKWKGELPGWGSLAGVEMVRNVMNFSLLCKYLEINLYLLSEVYVLPISID